MEQFSNAKFVVNEIIVHAGSFHADDVFCVAAMNLINPNVTCKRIANADLDEISLADGIIMADIGGGAFDHHQEDAPVRADGIRHCAFSRLWLEAGCTVVMSVEGKTVIDNNAIETAECIYNTLVRTIAAEDNGIDLNPNKVYSIGNVISCFIPGETSNRSVDEGFEEAVGFAKRILENEILSVKDIVEAKEVVKNALRRQRNGIVVLDRYVPWEKVVCEDPEARAVIYLSKREEFNIQLVPVEEGSFITRWNVPDNWKGKRGQDADQVQQGMTFCHVNGFLSCYRTMEEAVKAANYLYRWNTRV